MKVLVTGASGFVGRSLCDALLRKGYSEYSIVPAVRSPRGLPGECVVGEIDGKTDWREALHGVHAVVHLAARVHVMNDRVADPLTIFRSVNTEGTLHLARQCVAAGMQRFVFISSIKVNGEERAAPYTEADTPAPEDAYAISKWEAEQGLRQIAAETGLEVVILRPPLVYGPGVRANFLALLRAVARGIPLPLGAISNQRSLVYVGNLVDAMLRCLEHPAAADHTFLISDDEAVSTPQLVRRMAAALDRPARLVALPVPLLRAAATLAGKSALVTRLAGSLTIDSSAIRRELSWTPPFTLDEGLRETAAWYANQKVSPRKTAGKT
ncbi:MAG: SDR family oxidoreductase [Pseudomonadota bacterium]